MRGIHWPRLLAIGCTLAAGVFALDIAFHAWVVPELYDGYPQRARAEMTALMPFLFLTYIVQITMFCLLFLLVHPARGLKNAALWGLWGGLFVLLPNMQFFVGVAGTTWTLLLVQVVEGILLLVLAVTIFELTYRPCGRRASTSARAVRCSSSRKASSSAGSSGR